MPMASQQRVGSHEQETGFFRSWGGSWDTDYGRFFLGWYSSALERHGDRLLAAAAHVFRQNQPPVAARWAHHLNLPMALAQRYKAPGSTTYYTHF